MAVTISRKPKEDARPVKVPAVAYARLSQLSAATGRSRCELLGIAVMRLRLARGRNKESAK